MTNDLIFVWGIVVTVEKVKKVGHCARYLSWFLLVSAMVVVSAGYAGAYIRDKDEDFSRVPLIRDEEPPSFYSAYSHFNKYRQTDPVFKTYTVEDGDSFFDILKENGVSAEEALNIIRKTRKVFNTARIKPGNNIGFHLLPDEQSINQIDYEISDLKQLVIRISGESITARIVESDRQERVIASGESACDPKATVLKSLPGKAAIAGKAGRECQEIPSVSPNGRGR